MAKNKTKQKESNVISVAWNSKFEDLLCFGGFEFIGIKTNDIPMQTIEVISVYFFTNQNKKNQNH